MTSIGEEIMRAMGKKQASLRQDQDRIALQMYGVEYHTLTDSQQASVMFHLLWERSQ